MAQVSLCDVRKTFGAVSVVDGVSFEAAHGGFVALVGPSGSGKSTLLRMVAGLEDVTGGTIAIGDRVVNDVPAKARDIAMVFQNYALYPHMTVRQNLGFALRMRRLTTAEIARRVDEATRALDLSALLDRYPRQLSGGQRQRVATGRAIVREPQVFLFDEPLSNLDAKLRVHVRAELRELHRRLGITALYVTHDQVEAMTMADRIVVLNRGRVEQDGAPLELYDRPANTFVATFIGSPAMNLIDGHRTGNALLLADGDRIAIRPDCPAAEGAPLTIGIRPEHVALQNRDHQPMRVVAVELTGADTTVIATRGAMTLTAVVRERVTVANDAPIALSLPLDHQHYFNDAGRRIGPT